MRFFERYEKKIERIPFSGCWIWIGANNGKYGTVNIAHKIRKAHRESYADAYGGIPDGAHICHKCDVTLCVNPEHLFAGTKSDNVKDMVAKGRQCRGDRHPKHLNPFLVQRGETHGNAKLKDENIVYIRFQRGKMTTTALAAQFGVTSGLISAIQLRRAWKHIA